MKKLLILPLVFTGLITVSCNNSSGSSSSTGAQGNDTKTATTTSASGKGTITCLIDGNQKTFNVRKPFFDIPLNHDFQGPKDGLELLDGDRNNEGFQFEIKNSGTTTIKTDPSGDRNCMIGYYNPAGVLYAGADVIVTVTSYTQNQLTGTFSGKLVNVNYDGGLGGSGAKTAKNYPQYIQITDGKFDISK